MYPEHLTSPMSKELTDHGFKGLKTIEEVAQEMEIKAGTTLLVVNSVCGCAAGGARPGVKMAIQNSSVKPNKMLTVFAGVDKEATDKARSYMLPYPPSSPCIALFKEGQLVHFLERHHIEGKSPEMIAANLKNAIEHYCS
jgi:putative YphP/YqiW family bacilliredoxin